MNRFWVFFTPVLLTATVLLGGCGKSQDRGVIEGAALPQAVVDDRQSRQRSASGQEQQILFGDLHVHTTFSPDAFIMSVPLMGGSGLHPPADACDFARYCSQLDFWSISDHAEFLNQQRWRGIRETVSSAMRWRARLKTPTW